MILKMVLLLITAYAISISESEVSLAQEVRDNPGKTAPTKSDQEHRTMEGVEIQGTVEKPHAVYVVPWGDFQETVKELAPLHRSFRDEILKPVDREEFYRKYSRRSSSVKGGTP